MRALSDLAIFSLLPAIARSLKDSTRLVLEAPPGAGKTTGIPLALLDADWLGGRTILLLEPRRIAARAAAARMASLLGETTGETVGYRTRLDSRVSAKTRIEVVTEGILTRRLQSDPELAGIGIVIFDEFHERSLVADTGLALTLDTAKALRTDLRVLVMSATLDGGAVAHLLDDAPILRAEGRSFPVETRHLAAPQPGRPLAPTVAGAIESALGGTNGDVLVFLPGEREIRAVERMLHAPGVLVVPLYGALAPQAQDRVFAPAPAGIRKVVLATSIAETSLTIDGIRVVVDSGFSREPRFDPATGLTRLETVRVSQASADQRRGRAGRTAPGVCYRMWPQAATRGLFPRPPAEILQADLTPLALELALWGVNDPAALSWLDPPPQAAFTEARSLLRRLGALDTEGRITEHGRAMVRLPLHPRLAHMAISAHDRGLGQEAALLSALLTERDVLTGPGATRGADVRIRLEALVEHGRAALQPDGGVREGTRARVRAGARQICRLLRIPESTNSLQLDAIGVLVSLAYPDRIAQARVNGGFRLANGRGAALADLDPLNRESFLAVAEVGGGDKDARIFLAAPLSEREIEENFAPYLETRETAEWSSRTAAVEARRQKRLGALVLEDSHWMNAPPERVARALLDGVRTLGIATLPWTGAARQIQARIAFSSKDAPDEDWPDFSDGALFLELEQWLLPYLDGMRSRADLARLDLPRILADRLGWEHKQKLEQEAPDHIRLPSGRMAALDYGGGGAPVLAAKVQELFGLADTPRIGRKGVPIMIHILSPASRPVQITNDLAGFWRGSYADVRKDLRGRYPKHRWPEDPAHAAPLPPARSRR